MSEFGEWYDRRNARTNTTDSCDITLARRAWNAAIESTCSQREAYQRGYRAGARGQQEKIADWLYNNAPNGEVLAHAILKQEITDD